MNSEHWLVQSLERELSEWEQEGREEAINDGAVVGNRDDSFYPKDIQFLAGFIESNFDSDDRYTGDVLKIYYDAAFAHGYNSQAESRAEFLRTTRIP